MENRVAYLLPGFHIQWYKIDRAKEAEIDSHQYFWKFREGMNMV